MYKHFLLLTVCLLSPPLHSQIPARLFAPQPTPSPTPQATAPTPTPTPVLAVPLPQIADQAEELDRLLRDIEKDLEPIPELLNSGPEAKAQAEDVADRVRQTQDLLDGMPSMMQLQNEDRYWRALAEQYGRQRKLLTARAAGIEEKMRLLDAEQIRWQATRDEVADKPGLEVVVTRIDRELDSIGKLRADAQEQLNQILTLQNDIAEQDHEISIMLRKLEEAHERLRGRVFERDGNPLWRDRQLRFPDQPASELILLSVRRGFAGTRDFLLARKALAIGAGATYIVALLMALRLKKYVATAGKREEVVPGLRVFVRPFSVALLVTLLTTIGLTASAPTGVSFVVSLFYLVPVVRLLPLLTGPGMRKVVYTACVFYAFEWAHLVLQFGAVFKRELFVVIVVLAVIIFAWLTRPSVLRMESRSRWRRLLLAGIRIGLFLLASSVLLNILGYLSLSQILGVGTLFSAFIFALLYTMVRVLGLALAIILDSAWFQALPDGNSEVIERWAQRLLVLGAALLWINVDLYLFTVRGTVVDALKGVFEYPIGYGKTHITLGGTLSIVVFLVLGYGIANIASFIFGKVLLPRASLKGGMAYAISRVTYYVLLAALFFAALANAGLELNKFTVVTGALGVGLGFGLQNIVNNFASGLIVLFERPIRVGDTVEISGILGTVRRIGARSSTVLTAQGAEVIFPNSNLLSNQVTNWTLTSTRRRVEIHVGVSYSTDPEVVVGLLTEVARGNSRVLSFPQPQTSFLGFGENSLNFELTFWAPQAIWFDLKSEIGLEVLGALRKAGIEIPYPQRDLHVRSIESLNNNKEEAPQASESTNIKRMAGRR